ncbi:MAG: TetR/AcrR family transcriptional regulator [Candidatus Korobacteraceae bacterium]
MSNQAFIDSLVNASSAANRRKPAQDRSLRTVAHILDAACSLLSQIPFGEVTTTRIAAEPGLSVGAVYRFFPDSESIIHAIAVRHVLQVRDQVDKDVILPLLKQLQNLENFDPSVVLDRMVDAYVLYLDAHPDFRTISFGRHISAAIKARGGLPHTGLPAMLSTFMVERLRFPYTPELKLMLSVVSEGGERLIAYAYEQPTREERDLVIVETKKMLAGYLFPGK